MKKRLFIIAITTLCISCAQKPTVPDVVNTRTFNKSPSHTARTNSNNRKPPLPHNIMSHNEKSMIGGNPKREIAGNMSPSDIFERFSSAVFKIHTSTGYQGFQGSGFFISNSGVAVSNYHVFQGTTIGYEDIILSDGSMYKVTDVYYKSQENDFIIFRVGVTHKVNYVRIANTQPRVGEKIYTIGSPRGLDNTFSSGEISQIRENGDILQISAPIDHGSSGGVLLNSKGEAIGITSGGLDDSGANLNYAWSIDLIKPYIP